MADIFLQLDMANLLSKKKVVLIGDSNMRCVYKDFLCLLCKNSLLTQKELKSKLEPSFLNDSLKFSGELHNGRDFREERQFRSLPFHLDFFFVTHCYDNYVENKIIKYLRDIGPHVVIMNSCLWDISRWGPNGVNEYKKNLKTLMQQLKLLLPEKCLFIWTTTMPVSQSMKGGFLIPQLEFLRHQMRFEIMEANLYAWHVVSSYGFDVLDLHYYLQMDIKRRAKDGVHWTAIAMRRITNFILTHISLAWDCELPGRYESEELLDMINYPLYPFLAVPKIEQFVPRNEQRRKKAKARRRRKRKSSGNVAF